MTLSALLFFAGCGGSSEDTKATTPSSRDYPLHRDVTVTIFWIGESAGEENGNISNVASAWDEKWQARYGGEDSPDRRDGYFPEGFVPKENPFYVALPYNDLDETGSRKPHAASWIPWYSPHTPSGESLCKNRWVEISKGEKKVYAQWEDAGPFGEDDAAYVFGTSSPKNRINDHAGIDVSPAVRDYLNLRDIDKVNWRFVEDEDVPDGPWKRIVTVSGVDLPLWYRPDANVTWQWQLDGVPDTSYDVDLYDIDLFDTSEDLIRNIKAEGRKVICYFSAGSYEEWREDKDAFPSSALGKPLDGWEGERWVDIRSPDIRNIMKARLDLAKRKGCDGVEPDNVDGYDNDTGFPLAFSDQLEYNRFLAEEAHLRGLAIGLKNDLEQIPELQPWFDFALNEECHHYEECDRLEPFVDAGKPVLNAEYDSRYREDGAARDALCEDARRRGFRTLVLPIELDGTFRYPCD